MEAVHLPGHTRGHSGFRISGGVFFLSDIDLTGFGPYYGDAWSDLEDFDASLAKVRDEEADWYVTSHHKGVIEGREAFVELLDAFAAVIPRRHQAMLEFLAEPRTLGDMVARRFIYRPGGGGAVRRLGRAAERRPAREPACWGGARRSRWSQDGSRRKLRISAEVIRSEGRPAERTHRRGSLKPPTWTSRS